MGGLCWIDPYPVPDESSLSTADLSRGPHLRRRDLPPCPERPGVNPVGDQEAHRVIDRPPAGDDQKSVCSIGGPAAAAAAPTLASAVPTTARAAPRRRCRAGVITSQQQGAASSFAWAELNARGPDDALPFYQSVFGWGIRRSELPDSPDYVEFLVDGESVAGATELDALGPVGTPNYWLVYFGVDDVHIAFVKATGLGAAELVAPLDFPGGRFAIVSDPQGAVFGLLKAEPQG
jgi:predicted enzyme related to lactoylglutathione lyase